MTSALESHFTAAMEFARQGNLSAAEAGFRGVIAINDRFGAAHHMLSRTLEQQGRVADALEAMERAAEVEPDRPDHRFHLARLFISQGNPRRALEEAEELHRLVPGHARSVSLLVNTLVMQGVRAVQPELLDRALSICDSSGGALGPDGAELMRVPVLAAMQREGEARALLESRLSWPLRPHAARMALAWYQIAAGGAAERGVSDGSAIAPLLSGEGPEGNPEAYASALAVFTRMLRGLGVTEWADRYAKESIRLAPGSPASKLEAALLAEREGDSGTARRMLEQIAASGDVLARPSGSIADRAGKAALLHLGRLLDKQGEYVAGFDRVAAAMGALALDPDAQAFDLRAQGEMLDKYEAWIERADVSGWARSFDEPEGRLAPIFFVGFPRSGTTLTEQILDAHPDLVGTGEGAVFTAVVGEAQRDVGADPSGPESLDTLTDERVIELRERFYLHAGRVVGAEAASTRRIVDKLPLNIVRLGYVRRLFPESKVIVALRDPRDVCISCLYQSFGLNRAMVHFMRLDTTARMYARVMGLWLKYRERLGLDWIEHSYEAMVADPEGRVRRLLEFLGVPWDESVLRFHERAREKFINTPSVTGVVKPVYSSAKARWKRYGNRLDPVLPLLEPFIREFGYSEED